VALAPQHPEWREQQPFKGVLENDLGPLIAGGEHPLLELVMATHAGGTTGEFEQIVRQWIATARHPTVLNRLPEIDFVNDGPGKPVGIHQFIGRRPIAAFGNSDGDLAMLQWTCAGGGPHLCLYVHHTDEEREWAYDRTSSIGRLDRGLDEAAANGWTVVDMKQDWQRVFADDN
jgi:hypothetical protein